MLNVNVGDGRISVLHKLQGHSSEIHSLAWCPTPKEQIDFGKFGPHLFVKDLHVSQVAHQVGALSQFPKHEANRSIFTLSWTINVSPLQCYA